MFYGYYDKDPSTIGCQDKNGRPRIKLPGK